LGLALDESREDDHVFDDGGLTYVIEKGLYEQVKPIKVDYINTPMGSGFNISSNMPKAASCGSSCSC
jgi:Fe-S cluster assembly iron-binding protein IscA